MQRDEFTLDELAAATGMTARNVRAYQTKGLIPAPSRSGRRSVYRGEHLQRLQAIEQARRRGASLSLIAAHLAAGRALDRDTLIDWQPSVQGADTEIADPHDIAPLLAQYDEATQPDLDKLVAAGVLKPDGGHVYASGDLAQSLLDLQRHGFPLQVALGIAQQTLMVATPMAAVLREITEAVDDATAIQEHLGEVAWHVLRHLAKKQADPPP